MKEERTLAHGSGILLTLILALVVANVRAGEPRPTSNASNGRYSNLAPRESLSNSRLSAANISRAQSPAGPASSPDSKPASAGPVLSFASYFGRTSQDTINSLALGSDGSIFVAGIAAPAAGATHGDAFVARLSADGTTVLYWVDLGGSDATEARAIAVDAAGNAYVTGVTQAPDFPLLNPLQSSCSRNAKGACSGDAFVAKLNPDGSPAFSTYLGGSGEDAANAIALDAAGNIWIAGSTASTDFPVFKPLQPASAGQGDAFVAKIASDGSHVLFATYLGGTAADEARGIAVDAKGNIYVTGQTFSNDFPVQKALQTSCLPGPKQKCQGTAFIAKLSSDGSSLTYSTYLGGSGGDAGNSIAVGSLGHAYITGVTSSADFPVVKPFQSVSHGKSEAFVAKLSIDGSSLVYSTFFGGAADGTGTDIKVDGAGNMFVAGFTNSPDLPLSSPLQFACGKDRDGACTQDAFVAVLDPAGKKLEFATYLGGTSSDEGRGIAVDPHGNVFLAGATASIDFPTAERIPLPAANTGKQSTASASAAATLPANATPGGALVAKISGIVLAGGKPQPDSPPPFASNCSANSTNWLGGTGNWSNAARWSTGVVPNSPTVNVCIDNGNAAVSVVTLDITVTVGTLTVDSDDTLILHDNVDLFVNGNIANSGHIQFNSAGNVARLRLTNNVLLAGGGSITISNTAHNGNANIRSEGGFALTNVDNTIQGEGQIGNGTNLTLVNQANGVIDADTPGQVLLLNTGGATVTNTGAFEAANGGFLRTTTTVANAGGNIQANGSGSAVQFLSGTTIQGGTLTTVNNGALGPISGNNATLDGKTSGAVTVVGTFTVADNTDVFALGTLNNTGAMQFNSQQGNVARLRLTGNLQLMGGGTLTFSNTQHNGNANIRAEVASTLTNVDNTVQGEGQIGNGTSLTVLNQAKGTIDADVSGQALLLNLNGTTLTNQGTLEATGGGLLQVGNMLVINTGSTIQASGNGSAVQLLNGSIIQGGTVATANGGAFGPPSGNSTTLDGKTSGAVTVVGTFMLPDNTDVFVQGTLNNTGTMQFNSLGNVARLRLTGNLQLMGGGTLTFSNTQHNGNANIRADVASTLTNVDNTIQGEGQIGNGTGLTVLNQATFDANISKQALLFNNTGTITNAGLLEAVGGGVLQLGTTTVTLNNKAGVLKVDGANSAVQLLNGSTIQGGTLTTANGGVLGPASGNSIILDGTTQGAITNAGTFTVPDNADVFVTGTLNNTGTMQFNSLGNVSRLRLTANLQLMGGGTLTLSNTMHNGNANIRAEVASTLTNVDNTIQGEGQIGNGTGLTVLNQATFDANISKQALLFNNTGTITNAGLLEAVGGGVLQLGTTTVTLNNKAGVLKVDGASSAVQLLNGSTIQGGTLTTANGGVLGVASGQSIILDGTTQGAITNAGTFTVPDNADLFVFGTLNNTGAMQFNSQGNVSRLRLNGNLQLMGGGTLTLSNTMHNGNANIRAEGGFTLTNVNNTIQGEGQVGNGTGLVVMNQGSILANVSKQALLFNSSSTPVNAGLLEAVGGGVLQLGTTSVTLNNKAGVLKVDGATSAVQLLNGSTIQGGTLTTANGGVLGVASGQSIILDGTTQGAITNAGTFTVPDNADLFVFGTLNNTGAMQFNSQGNVSRLRLTANLQLMGGGTLTLSNTMHNGNANIRAEGGFTLTNADNTIQGEGQIGNGTGLVVANQGTINANVSGQTLLLNNAGASSNAGVLEASKGSNLQLTSAALNNAGGTIKIDGTLTTPTGFSPTGGALIGTGNISGSLTSGGVIQPGDAPTPGILTINGSGGGNYTQTAGGGFTVPIGGTTLGTQFSQLSVAGTATLAGALNVNLINGFTPAVGNTFVILNAGSVTGQFTTTNFTTLPGNVIFKIAYASNNVTLSAAAAQQVVSFNPASLNFGSQAVGVVSAISNLQVTNNGNVAVHISSVAVSGTNAADFVLGAASSGTPAPLTPCNLTATTALAPGASCFVGVTFKPSIVGAENAVINFTDDAPGSPESVPLLGTGLGAIATLSTTSVVFQPTALGSTSAAVNVTLTNSGNSGLIFNANGNVVTLSGANPGDFAVGTATTCFGDSTVQPNGSCLISFTFTPTANGQRTATATISDNAGTGTQTIMLTGSTPTTATLSTNTLNFGNQGVGAASNPMTVTLTNSGASPLNFQLPPTFSGPNAGEFGSSSATTCMQGTPVAPNGGTCVLSVTFTPAGTGARTATLTLTDSAGTQTIALSGTGVQVTITGPSGPVVVQPGQLGVIPIVITPGPGGFPAPITLTPNPVAPAPCFPVGLAVEIPQPMQTPGNNSVTASVWVFTTGPNTGTVTGTTGGAVPPLFFNDGNRRTPPAARLFAVLAVFSVVLMLMWIARRLHGRSAPRYGWLVPALAIVLGVISFAGCGGGGTTGLGTGIAQPGTTQIMVTATSGTYKQSIIVSIQVQ